jgi:hypothetical protein
MCVDPLITLQAPFFVPPALPHHTTTLLTAHSEEGGQFRFSLPLQDLVSVDLQPEIYIRQGGGNLGPRRGWKTGLRYLQTAFPGHQAHAKASGNPVNGALLAVVRRPAGLALHPATPACLVPAAVWRQSRSSAA